MKEMKGVNSDWTASHLTDPGGDDCESMTNAKSYMQEMSSTSCTISPYFDLNSILNVMCVALNELDITDGLPDERSNGDISVSSSTASLCGVSAASGATMSDVSVSATSTQTYYQRYITFTINSNITLFRIFMDLSESP